MESVTPILNARDAAATRAFYEAAGFSVTYWQDRPYLYGAIERGNIRLHIIKGKHPGTVLINVPEITPYHTSIADGLRAHYGYVPTSGIPRISRRWSWHTRFRLFDPLGNELIVVNNDEPEIDYDAWDETLSPLRQALVTVEFLRDVYTDDQAAAKLLDKKLTEFVEATNADRARALGIRGELALAMGNRQKFAETRAMLEEIVLTEEERALHCEYLEAAKRLDAWISTGNERDLDDESTPGSSGIHRASGRAE